MLTRAEIIEARNQTIVISNRLIQDSYFSLNKIPLKTLLFAISKIKEDDEPYKKYTISTREVCEICNFREKGTNTYKGRYGKIYLAMRELRAMHLDLPDGRGHWFNTGWFASVDIDENDNDTISYWFDAKLMPYLFNLKKELGHLTYTTYEIILAMATPAGIRLYLFLRSIAYRGIKQQISIDELRDRMGYRGMYEKYKDLRVRILEPAIKDVNEFSDIEISTEEVLQGKKVVALDFTIHSRNLLTDEQKRTRRRNRTAVLYGAKSRNSTFKKAATQKYVNIYRMAEKKGDE